MTFNSERAEMLLADVIASAPIERAAKVAALRGSGDQRLWARVAAEGPEPDDLWARQCPPTAEQAVQVLMFQPAWAPTLFAVLDDDALSRVSTLLGAGAHRCEPAVWHALLDEGRLDAEALVSAVCSLGFNMSADAAAFAKAVVLLDEFPALDADADRVVDIAAVWAACLAFSSCDGRRRDAWDHLTGGDIPAALLCDVTDRLCETIIATRKVREVTELCDFVEDMCEEHGHLMVPQRPRLAAAFRTAGDADDISRLGRRAARKAASTLDLPETLGTLGRFSAPVKLSALICAGEDTPPHWWDQVTRLFRDDSTASNLNRGVERLVARLLVLNPNTPDAVVREILGSRHRNAAGAVLADRPQLSPQLAAWSQRVFGWQWHVEVLSHCTDPGLAVTLLLNEVGFVSGSSMHEWVTWADRHHLAELVQPEVLEVFAWGEIGSDTTVAHVVARWAQDAFGPEPAKFRFALEMLDGFEGQFGDLAALCDATGL